MGMNDRQKQFCREYLVDQNVTKAAKRAGYSAKTAYSQGHELLKKPEIQAEIQRGMDARARRVEVKADDVLRELLRLAMVDLSKAYDEQGNLLHPKDMPEDVRKAIAGIEVYYDYEGRGEDRVRIGETRKVKFWDKPRVLEMLGRHLKLFTDKIDVSGSITLEKLVEESWRKIEGGKTESA